MRFIVAAILCAIPLFSTHAAPPQIRVTLAREATQVRLIGRNFYCYLPGTPDSERTRLPRQAALIRHTGAGFMLDAQFLPGSTLECISGEGILTINNIPTQGQITFSPDGPQKTAAVVALPMEQYLIGVMQGELGQNWPPEALKAQAIAARSYATAVMHERRSKSYDIATTTRDQVYTASVKIPTPIQAAVLDTQGQILKYKNVTLKAFYHSCCGGKGEELQAVWKDLSPGKTPPPFPKTAAKDPFCRRAPVVHWEYKTTDTDVLRTLQAQTPVMTSFDQLSFQKNENGRVATVAPHISGNQFRKALGYEKLKSTWFTVKRRGHTVIFEGRGYGHGVGLCQWGARGMADKGKTAAEILQFYYPGAELTKVY